MDFKKATDCLQTLILMATRCRLRAKPGQSPVLRRFGACRRRKRINWRRLWKHPRQRWNVSGQRRFTIRRRTERDSSLLCGQSACSIVAERSNTMTKKESWLLSRLRIYKKINYQRIFFLNDFLKKWSKADKKQAIIEELANEGVFFDALEVEIGKKLDPFDIVCHVAWDKPPLTRKERAENVRKRNYFAKYGEQAQRVIAAFSTSMRMKAWRTLKRHKY